MFEPWKAKGELRAEVDVREREGWERTERERKEGGRDSEARRAGGSKGLLGSESRREARLEGERRRE